jgi:protein-S-isoprenylcysteine O-methyltransferase Ste14
MYIELVIDAILVIGFVAVHSVLATFKAKKMGKLLFFPHFYRLLYSIVSAIYILIAAYLWKSVPIEIYQATGYLSLVIVVIGMLGWGLYFYSHLTYYDVGVVFGTSQFFSSNVDLVSQPRFDYSTNGFKSYVRFPVHTAFIPMFFAFPSMNASSFLFAVLASLYAWAGTFHHDSRYIKTFGEDYEDYKKHTGMVFPRISKGKIIRYTKTIYDTTPRIEAIPFIILLMLVTILLSLVCANALVTFSVSSKTELLIIPIFCIGISLFSALAIVPFWKRLHFTNRPKDNLKKVECAAFGFGVVGALTIGIIYSVAYFLSGKLLHIAAIIPSWVLSFIVAHFVYFSVVIVAKTRKNQ